MEGGKDPRRALGSLAEDLASAVLVAAGYRILDRNFHARRAELDLVASRGAQVVFVEVRSQRGSYLDSPALTVTPAKQHRVVTAARAWLALRRMGRRPVRFDVVAVRFRGASPPRIEWIEDAFRPGDTSRRERYF